jgi:hypothetical protein
MEGKIYLAGPITGCSYGGCTEWREYVAKNLIPGVKVISPLRGKDYLLKEKSIRDSYEHTALSCQKGITARDRSDVTRSDVIMVNFLGAERVSIGSVMEIAWADAWRKIIIIIMDEKNIHSHSMIREVASYIVSNLDDAIFIANVYFS